MPLLDETQKSKPNPVKKTVLATLTALVLLAYPIALCLGPIIHGDDTFTAFSYLEAWTSALKAGNALSTWSPVASNGYGSPMPFFYHKLFNLTGAVLTLLSGDIIAGYRLALMVFSAVMFWGAYQCAKHLRLDRLSGVTTATACLLAPYAIDNFVERAAVAEYAAMALVPCILAAALDLYMDRHRGRRPLTLMILLTLQAFAHVLIFVVMIGLLLVLAMYMIATARRNAWVFAASVTAVLIAFTCLIYIPFSYWSTYFCADQVRAFGRPGDYLVPYADVLLPLPWSRLGYPGIALLIGLYLKLRGKQYTSPTDRLVLGLGATAIVLILAITPIAKPLWQLSPELDFIQFPWRLLAIATPIAIIALFGSIGNPGSAWAAHAQLGLFIVVILNAGIALSWLKFLPTEPVTIAPAELRHQTPSSSPGPNATGEYFPAAFQSQLDQINFKRWGTAASTVLPKPRPLIQTERCTFPAITRPSYFDTLRFSTICSPAGKIRINQFATPFLIGVAVNASGVTVKPLANTETIDFILPPGRWSIIVRQRSYMELVAIAWQARLSSVRRKLLAS